MFVLKKKDCGDIRQVLSDGVCPLIKGRNFLEFFSLFCEILHIEREYQTTAALHLEVPVKSDVVFLYLIV